jgi:hypothetical protein
VVLSVFALAFLSPWDSPLPHCLYDVEDGAQFCLFVKVVCKGGIRCCVCRGSVLRGLWRVCAPPCHRDVIRPSLLPAHGCSALSTCGATGGLAQDPSKDTKARLEASPVPGVTKVIGYTKLRKNYHEFQQKRALVAAYDAFFTDDRILPMLPALLGKVRAAEEERHPAPTRAPCSQLTVSVVPLLLCAPPALQTFFEKKRQPMPVRLTKVGGGWRARGHGVNAMSMSSSSCSCVRVCVCSTAPLSPTCPRS